MKIGIMSAMEEENVLLISKMSYTSTLECANRTYTSGKYHGHDVIVTFSRWGKVASAITAAFLIHNYKIDALIFTGVAGSCLQNVKIGDIVVASDLVQYDMDARPIFKRFEIPLIGVEAFNVREDILEKTVNASIFFANNHHLYLSKHAIENFKIDSPKVFTGTIATGDKFFSSKQEILDLKNAIPGALCVEMEGAAVAQVCHEHGIPFSIIRTISDSGDENSHLDFALFVKTVASPYSLGIIDQLLPSL